MSESEGLAGHWCVAIPHPDGRVVQLPARSREHAERMNQKLKGGEVKQWEGDPEVHEIMLTGITRALASFGS